MSERIKVEAGGKEYVFRGYLTLEDLINMPLPNSPDEQVDIKAVLLSNAKLIADLSIDPKLTPEQVKKMPLKTLKPILDKVLKPLLEDINSFLQ